MDSSHLLHIYPGYWALGGKQSWNALLMVGAHKAVGEVVDHCRAYGDLCHSVKDEGRRIVDQSEGPGRFVQEGNQGKDPGKGVLTHYAEEGYGCNLLEHTVVAAGRGNLENKNVTLLKKKIKK